MALDVGGRTDRGRARPTSGWSRMQRPDGAWHQLLPGRPASSRTKLDTNVCAYVATGVWHHYLLTGDRGFLEAMWPVVERAIDFVLRPADAARRDRLGPPRRRHARGRSPCSPARRPSATACAARSRSPSGSATSVPTGSSPPRRLAHVDRARARRVRAQAPLGDGLVLPGARRRRHAAPAGRSSARRAPEHVRDGRARACAASRTGRGSPRPRPASARWPTWPSATRPRLSSCSRWAQAHRHDDGAYWTGIVYPEGTSFPGDERTTYTAAAVVLAADALSRASAASGLFLGEDIPAFIDTSDSVTD